MNIDAVLMCVECRQEQMIKRAEARWGGKVPVFDLDGRRCNSLSRHESLTETRMTPRVLQETERPSTH